MERVSEPTLLDLAKVRTYLAGRRSCLSGFRTTLARGRTGIAFVTVVLVLLRFFGLGLTLPLEALFLSVGVFFYRRQHLVFAGPLLANASIASRQRRPDNPQYAYTLALFLYRAKQSGQSLEVLRLVVEANPGYREAVGLYSEILKKTRAR